MPTNPLLDSDGKLVVKVTPNQVTVGPDGKVHIDSRALKDFLDKKTPTMDSDAHIILMGSDCGCKCCC